jgi:hypothetical protein
MGRVMARHSYGPPALTVCAPAARQVMRPCCMSLFATLCWRKHAKFSLSHHVRVYTLPLVSTVTIVVPQAPPLPFSIEDSSLKGVCQFRRTVASVASPGARLRCHRWRWRVAVLRWIAAVRATAGDFIYCGICGHAAAMVEIDIKRHNSAGRDACASPLCFSSVAAALSMVACQAHVLSNIWR